MHEFFVRPRGQTTSAITAARPCPPQSPSSGTGTLASPLSRVVSESSVPHAEHGRTSGFSVFGISIGAARKRKDSVDSGYLKEQDAVSSLKRRSGVSTPLMMGSPVSWWAGMEEQAEEHRPWRDPPKRKNTVPEEQTEGWVHARGRVGQAVKSVLGTATDVAHEILFTGMPVLNSVPVPGLGAAAYILLEIWDALQLVDTNRLQCIRLTERCADILLSVREEVKEAGDQVDEELQVPIAKLTESFHAVQSFLLKQVHRPFLKRYLKRDEIQAQIRTCHAGLTEALGMLGLSIQIRTLKSVQEAERGRREDQRVLMEILRRGAEGEGIGLGLTGMEIPAMGTSESSVTIRPSQSQTRVLEPSPSSNRGTPTLTIPSLSPSASATRIPSVSPSPASTQTPDFLRPSQVLPTLKTVQASQDALDEERDSEDLRELMRAALQAGSDLEMLNVLQIGREEMPEAIKTLQRALERVGDAEAEAEKAKGMDGEKEKKKWGLGRMRALTETGTSPGKRGVSMSGSAEKRRKSVDVAIATGNGNRNRNFADSWGPDALDREFIESGIDALRRMSRGAGIATSSLPPWTITRYEVDREQKIGIGFFSDVYRGTWRGRTVAIKVLAPTTPRELFVREVQVWRGLRHPGVLELYGASSACGERPWFFVCAYMRRGSLVEFLKRMERRVEGRIASAGMDGRTVFPIWEECQGLGVEWSQNVQEGNEEATLRKEGDLFRYMLEIAQGMEYLHSNGVLHGDLKAANVLVDDDVHCVISDFGQSEMKSEVYRISGTTPPRTFVLFLNFTSLTLESVGGTLRWQAPELMSGESQLALTPQMDVYAYAILCVEIVAMGKLPWPFADDDTVRHFVLRMSSLRSSQHIPKAFVGENIRPAIPLSRFNTPSFQELLHVCWDHDPIVRPTFDVIVKDVEVMRQAFLSDLGEEHPLPSPSPVTFDKSTRPREWERDHSRSKPSPDMRPVSLHFGTPPAANSSLVGQGASPDPLETFGMTEEGLSSASSTKAGYHEYHREDLVSSGRFRMPEPVLYTPSIPSDSSCSLASSLFTTTLSNSSLQELGLTTPGRPVLEVEMYDSPAPQDERIKSMRDERRYRLLLNHQFHPSLTLPLWEPSSVKLGAVGYLLKPEGKFITLFNSFSPEKGQESAVHGLPSLYGYGRVLSGGQRQDKRNAAQRGYDAFVGLLTFRGKSGAVSSQSIARRYSFPLRAGHKTAHMFTESTMYRYMERLEVPKRWFKANVDAIMQIYGPMHHIQKEDLFLVIGTLEAQEYALFVSHNHPDGQAHFNVFSSPRNGAPWGTFTTDTEVPSQMGGPSYDEPVPGHAISSSKVSKVGPNWETVLVSRLRFKPDALEPTSL
ncbi:hypothetical protein C0992_009504 [Termitomyces sp. T32_za158]|nr:hypothetical protein C0992_009504 [Termitomyces sp. T32_za158]